MGGEDASPFEFPWIASRVYKEDWDSIEPFCAATLINDRYAITAVSSIPKKYYLQLIEYL